MHKSFKDSDVQIFFPSVKTPYLARLAGLELSSLETYMRQAPSRWYQAITGEQFRATLLTPLVRRRRVLKRTYPDLQTRSIVITHPSGAATTTRSFYEAAALVGMTAGTIREYIRKDGVFRRDGYSFTIKTPGCLVDCDPRLPGYPVVVSTISEVREVLPFHTSAESIGRALGAEGRWTRHDGGVWTVTRLKEVLI